MSYDSRCLLKSEILRVLVLFFLAVLRTKLFYLPHLIILLNSENAASRQDNHVTSLPDFSSNTILKNKYKMTSDCCVLKFLSFIADGKHLTRYQSGKAVSKFHGSSADCRLDHQQLFGKRARVPPPCPLRTLFSRRNVDRT